MRLLLSSLFILLAAAAPAQAPLSWQRQSGESCTAYVARYAAAGTVTAWDQIGPSSYRRRTVTAAYALWHRHWCVKVRGKLCDEDRNTTRRPIHPYWLTKGHMCTELGWANQSVFSDGFESGDLSAWSSVVG